MSTQPRVLVVDEWPNASSICGSGLGSTLLKLPALADARRHGFDLTLVTSAAKAELLQFSSIFRQVLSVESVDCLDRSEFNFCVVFGLERPSDFSKLELRGDFRKPAQAKLDYNRVPHIQYWRSVMAKYCGYAMPESAAEFPFCCQDSPNFRQFGSRDYVVLSLSALSDLKRYKAWGQVIEKLLKQSIPCVLVGMEAPTQDYDSPLLVDLTRKTTLTELVAWIQHSRVVAGTDGLTTNLAMALGRPCVNLFTIIQPDFVIAKERQQKIPLIPMITGNCPLQPCYHELRNYRHDECPLKKQDPERALECTKFDPEAVLKNIMKLWRVEGERLA